MSIDAHPIRRRSLGLLCSLLVSLTAASALADTLAMQGVLRSGAGGPVADGEYGMEVALFADAAASQLVYKQLFIAVPVQAGLFAVVLGLDPANPLDGPAVAANAGFVRVTVGSEPPLPTQALSPALMAHRATLADQALVAQQAISAQTAITADTASAADEANVANKALSLECTGCLATAMYADGSVTQPKLAAGAVGPDQLADGAVTAAKIDLGCADGELLRKVGGQWTCFDLDAALAPKPAAAVWTVDGTTTVCQNAKPFSPVPDMALEVVLEAPSVVLVHFDMNVVGGNGHGVAARLVVDGQPDASPLMVQPSASGEDDHIHAFRIAELQAGAHTITAEWGEAVGEMCNQAASPHWLRRLSALAVPLSMGPQYGYVEATTDACRTPGAYETVPELTLQAELAEESVVLTEADLTVRGPSGFWTALRLSVDDNPDPEATHGNPHGSANESDLLHLFRIDTLQAGPHTVSAQWGLGANEACNKPATEPTGRRVGWLALPKSSGVLSAYSAGTSNACVSGGSTAMPDMNAALALTKPVFTAALTMLDATVTPQGSGHWTAMDIAVDGVALPRFTHCQPNGSTSEDDHLHAHRVDVLGPGTHAFEGRWGGGSGTMCNDAANATPVWTRRLGVIALPAP